MPIALEQFVESIRPERTILLFGSGSSIPSGAPSVGQIIDFLSKRFGIESADLNLQEMAGIIEKRTNRRELISSIRSLFKDVRPTGGLLTLPRFSWKNIYTTNYDDLIERVYDRAKVPLSVYSSNFDFKMHEVPEAVKLLKLHGTLNQDISDGHQARWILTENDYDLTDEYREYLYDTLKTDMAGSDLIIIGHSLADPDIKALINRAISISQKAFNAGNIYLLMYSQNLERAELHEARGLKVCFGDIDQFFASLNKRAPDLVKVHIETENPLDSTPSLQPITIDSEHTLSATSANISEMFNGWPASYSDIAAGNTFQRDVISISDHQLFNNEKFGALFLGASGVGKTTAARQLLHALMKRDFFVWEHKSDHTLLPEEWLKIASILETREKDGVLFIDDADTHLYEINALFEDLESKGFKRLRIVLTAARNRWNPRVKSPALFSNTETYVFEKLSATEITELLRLLDTNRQVSSLVDNSFMGFSVSEKRRRLEDRCEKDMFVCLKNIFASEKFDDIVLREYAQLDPKYRDIYKYVAALESSGVKVHRQLIIRLLNIPMNSIDSILENLTDIVHEYTISEKEGIYAWRGRHPVIMGIIADFKFAETENFVTLFEKVISALSPTFDIEIRTLRDLCTMSGGISRIPDKNIQNRILAKMISVAPGERVPRHRLIRNLIEMGEFEKAEAEIRLFSKDFQEDGPVYRYRTRLALERAINAPGLLEEDRLVILDRARKLSVAGIMKYKNNKNMLFTYCDVGYEIFKRTGELEVFDDAIKALKDAEQIIGDPDIARQISYYERKVTGQKSSIAA